MMAAGIDLGGTKIEAQIFDANWQLSDRRRVETPKDYDALVTAMADQIGWISRQAGPAIPIGVSAAGLINPANGLALTANLPASGKPFPADIVAASGHLVTYINDCRAFILSESAFGAAKGASPALGVIFGTGLAGGVVTDGHLMAGHATIGGEFGHFSLAAGPMLAHGLPILACGCGRSGCVETLLSGPGLSRLAAYHAGRTLSAQQIVSARDVDPALGRVWNVWLDLAAEFLMTLCLTIDPEVIVLGGGLSNAPGLTEDLTAALGRVSLAGFRLPEIRLAQGGDASGARGAALAAWQAAKGGP